MSESENPYSSPEAELQVAENPGDFALGDIKACPIGSGANWLGEGFNYFKQSPGPWIGTCIVGLLLMIAIGLIPLGNIIIGFLTYVFLGGLMLGVKAQYDGQPFELNYLFAGFKTHFGKLLLVGVIYQVAVILLMIISFAPFALSFITSGFDVNQVDFRMLMLALLVFMALIIPAIMAVYFAPCLIVLNDVDLLQALKLSFKGCLKNIMPFLIYGILITLVMFVAMIPLGLGMLVAMPMLFASTFAAYKEIYIA